MECCIFAWPSRLASGVLSCTWPRRTTYHLWCLGISRLHSGLDFHLLYTLALLMHRNEWQQVLGARLRKMGLILAHRWCIGSPLQKLAGWSRPAWCETREYVYLTLLSEIRQLDRYRNYATIGTNLYSHELLHSSDHFYFFLCAVQSW